MNLLVLRGANCDAFRAKNNLALPVQQVSTGLEAGFTSMCEGLVHLVTCYVQLNGHMKHPSEVYERGVGTSRDHPTS